MPALPPGGRRVRRGAPPGAGSTAGGGRPPRPPPSRPLPSRPLPPRSPPPRPRLGRASGRRRRPTKTHRRRRRPCATRRPSRWRSRHGPEHPLQQGAGGAPAVRARDPDVPHVRHVLERRRGAHPRAPRRVVPGRDAGRSAFRVCVRGATLPKPPRTQTQTPKAPRGPQPPTRSRSRTTTAAPRRRGARGAALLRRTAPPRRLPPRPRRAPPPALAGDQRFLLAGLSGPAVVDERGRSRPCAVGPAQSRDGGIEAGATRGWWPPPRPPMPPPSPPRPSASSARATGGSRGNPRNVEPAALCFRLTFRDPRCSPAGPRGALPDGHHRTEPRGRLRRCARTPHPRARRRRAPVGHRTAPAGRFAVGARASPVRSPTSASSA